MTQKKSSQARVVVEAPVGEGTISLESGWWAKQADGSIVVRQGDTAVLVTMCTADARPDQSFFPLTVDYQEKGYAAGKIPGGFFKREGRPAEHEILACRLVDRPIRPMFPDGFMDEVQIICTVISADGVYSPEILAITAASAALHISKLPFEGPIAAVRVGRVDGKLLANPTTAQLEKSDLDFVVAGSKEAIVMVEGGAQFVPENEVLDALYFAHDSLQALIKMQEDLRSKVGVEKIEFVAPESDAELAAKVRELGQSRLQEACSIQGKSERYDAIGAIKDEVLAALAEEYPERNGEIQEELHHIVKDFVRGRILDSGLRIDGRSPGDVRFIECETSVLPRAHGSAVFTRGETQALVTATLGTSIDAQRIDSLTGQSEKTFLLHYNFPPYSTGEVKFMRGTGRREIGHGALAERALRPVIPAKEEFPYVVRVVSDVLESNGSSSMATVCGGSLAMMDAGIAIKAPVGGVAMGLIKEDDRVAILTDILGDEDHLGDMDFKVCGTKDGITALQMDIKCSGLSRKTMETALDQAREGRVHILDEMAKELAAARENMSPYAPTIKTIQINPDKIRDLIGPGGKTIRSITESTGVKIDISDDGKVDIAGSDQAAIARAIEIIEGLTEEPEVGKKYCGVVKRITDFGAFVEILPGLDGLLHISQLRNERVERVSDVVKEGDEIMVVVLDIDKQGRIRLSHKELDNYPD
ncbi:MAG: polyribonucleotide nucleotidyltransferase [Bdellovibrionales bacterium]|nr:polyribonucleotide nucleotidyltransferase [Bdellovibrionales bacterium]